MVTARAALATSARPPCLAGVRAGAGPTVILGAFRRGCQAVLGKELKVRPLAPGWGRGQLVTRRKLSLWPGSPFPKAGLQPLWRAGTETRPRGLEPARQHGRRPGGGRQPWDAPQAITDTAAQVSFYSNKNQGCPVSSTVPWAGSPRTVPQPGPPGPQGGRVEGSDRLGLGPHSALPHGGAWGGSLVRSGGGGGWGPGQGTARGESWWLEEGAWAGPVTAPSCRNLRADGGRLGQRSQFPHLPAWPELPHLALWPLGRNRPSLSVRGCRASVGAGGGA